jgi:hypothetical protein
MDIDSFRAPQMRQIKAQLAGNGVSLARAATQQLVLQCHAEWVNTHGGAH